MPPMRLQPWMAGVAAALVFAMGFSVVFVVAALADSPPTTVATTSEPTTTEPATTSTTTATTTTTTTTTTTMTAPATTTTTTVTSTAPTRTAPATSRSRATPTPARELSLVRCPIAAVIVLLPNGAPIAVGAVADARTGAATIKTLTYPSDGAVATASAATLDEGTCTKDGPTHAAADLRSVSLFAGLVRSTLVSLRIRNGVSTSVAGLVVGSKHVPASAGTRVPLQSWGDVVAGSRAPIHLAGGGTAIAALAVHLLRTHAGLPAGTTVLLAVAAHRHTKHARAHHEPLKVTPPLGESHLIFPVAGASAYADTYGAYRSDVSGKWHHGDDIFAPLGTPVVAVASGTINRVGWERAGGWRVWVRDDAGDEFYYAHLSGYTRNDLHSKRVRAGEVIGFIGNTGDAFTTSPHLHFEIHPRPLLHLGYDGAVDPTKYLDSWTHLRHVDAPRPAHPRLPKQPLIRREARYVFRQLLAARHLVKRPPEPSQRPHVPVPAGANGPPIAQPPPPGREAAAATSADAGTSTLTVALLTTLGLLALFAAAIASTPLRHRLKSRDTAREEADPSAPPTETRENAG